MDTGTRLSPKFLADLKEVYGNLRPPALSAVFLSSLKRVYDTLPVASDDNLRFLAVHFDEWRRKTKEFVRTHLAELNKDDPLICPISLFRTMDSGRLETTHTRALAWLLDSEGEHGFGTTLLAALLRRLSGHDCSAALQIERVESEYVIDAFDVNGRLDVLAEGTWKDGERSGWILVIEAKVDSAEGEDQLQKYEEWLRSNAAGREIFRVFLTPDGHPPETGTEEWEAISFLELVRIFRAAYRALCDAPGFHFLKFYLAGVLQDVCGMFRNIEKDDPYAVAAFLRKVHEFRSEGASHDATR